MLQLAKSSGNHNFMIERITPEGNFVFIEHDDSGNANSAASDPPIEVT